MNMTIRDTRTGEEHLLKKAKLSVWGAYRYTDIGGIVTGIYNQPVRCKPFRLDMAPGKLARILEKPHAYQVIAESKRGEDIIGEFNTQEEAEEAKRQFQIKADAGDVLEYDSTDFAFWWYAPER